MGDSTLRVGLIGCGGIAANHILPALLNRQLCERVKLSWVADTSRLNDRQYLQPFQLGNLGLINLITDLNLQPGVYARPPQEMLNCLKSRLAEVDAVIISTYNMSHKDYCKLSLEQGKHTLVDKPLTVREFCTTDVNQAEGIYKDFEDLCKLARDKEALFMLCTQRRYQPAYREIAQRLVDVHKKSGEEVTFVQCMTSDGWWLNDKDEDEKDGSGGIHSHRGYDPLQAGGGKLVKTGYHILDIVPWLLRHLDIPIKSAEISVNFQRPPDLRQSTDSFESNAYRLSDSTFTLPIDCKPSAQGTTIPFKYLPEVNATLQIALCDEKPAPRCLIQMGMLHEGLSLRGCAGAESRRTKIETMHLFQGPVSMVSLRRFGKITNGDQFGLGGMQHYELIMGKNPHHVGGGLSLESLITHYDERDVDPALEFLNTAHKIVCRNASLKNCQVTSPVSDHEVGIRLLSEAYKAAARTFCSLGKQQPAWFDFDSWQKPPNVAEWIRPS